MTGVVIVILVVIGIVIALSAAQRTREHELDSEPYVPAATGGFDVSVVRIGVDGRASKFVQTELAAIKKTYDLAQDESRARALREVTIMLRRVRDSWMYGDATNEPMRPRGEAVAAYTRLLDAANARPEGGGAGESVLLVALVIGSRGELLTVAPSPSSEDLRRALEAAIHRPASDLIGFDVIWHSTSSDALDGSMHRLQGSMAGKKLCTFCGGPFPAELVTCPHCGAPAREQRAS